jgi:hypothetical protein
MRERGIAVIADIARDRRDREIKPGLPRIDADERGSGRIGTSKNRENGGIGKANTYH